MFLSTSVLCDRPLLMDLDIELVLTTVVVVLLIYVFALHQHRPLHNNLSAILSTLGWSSAKTKAKQKKGWPAYILKRKEVLSTDTVRLTFSVPQNGVKKKIGKGRHILARALINDEERVVRPYTPTNASPDELELVVKRYELGKLSPHLYAMVIGDSVEMFGPVGQLKYAPGSVPQLVMLAAGTGITPVYSMARDVLEDPDDAATRVTVLFQCRNESDILLRDELTKLAARHPKNLRLVLACSRAGAAFSSKSANVRQLSGYLTAEVVNSELPGIKSPDGPHPCRAFCCGPSGFNSTMREIAEARGYVTKELFHQF